MCFIPPYVAMTALSYKLHGKNGLGTSQERTPQTTLIGENYGKKN
jgi:hypothetical protein